MFYLDWTTPLCCCRYDRDNSGKTNIFHCISSSLSIFYQQAVSKATARLTVAMNNSFAHKLRIDTDCDEFNVPETPKHNGSFFTSFDSKASSGSLYNRPTVLNVGLISGMKTKGGRVYSAKRIERPPVSSPFTSDIPIFPTSSTADISIDDDLEYDCVEDKLNEAMRLKEARNLGMNRECLALKDFSIKGELFIVKELLKLTLELVISSGETDSNETVDKVRLYAKDVNADFDEAVRQYSVELCDSNRDNIPSILHKTEKLSRWVSSPAVRCLIVLKMLRKALVSIQRPPDLSALAAEALNWVADGNVKSELEEALRLLSIDSLVRKYCGNGASCVFLNDFQSVRT